MEKEPMSKDSVAASLSNTLFLILIPNLCIYSELMRAQDEEEVSFDLPVRGGNNIDGNSIGGQSGTLHSPTTSRDSPSTVSESHLVCTCIL